MKCPFNPFQSPFVQRVWIALELKGIPYQYIEVDPYAKPASLLEVNPRGLVPALRHDNWGCYESNVLLEYVKPTNRCFNLSLTNQPQLEDLGVGAAMLPADAKLRAHCRLWADHVCKQELPGPGPLLICGRSIGILCLVSTRSYRSRTSRGRLRRRRAYGPPWSSYSRWHIPKDLSSWAHRCPL